MVMGPLSSFQSLTIGILYNMNFIFSQCLLFYKCLILPSYLQNVTFINILAKMNFLEYQKCHTFVLTIVIDEINITFSGSPLYPFQAAHQTLEEKYGKYGILFKQNMGQIWDFLTEIWDIYGKRVSK